MKYVILILLGSILGCGSPSKGIVTVAEISFDSEINSYCMSLDGSIFFFISKGSLFKYNLKGNNVDSIDLAIDKSNHINILSINNGIMLLYFNKFYQYDTNKVRHIGLMKLDKNLSMVYRDSFMVNKGHYILDEDFNFTNGYYSSANNTYLLNNAFGQCIVLKNNIWEVRFEQITVDPITGEIYMFDQQKLKENQIYLNNYKLQNTDILCKAKQSSVFNNKLIYFCDSKIYFRNVAIKDTDHEIQNEHRFNVCRRFENGVYKFEDNMLWVCKLF